MAKREELMASLRSVNWGEFAIGDLFDVVLSKGDNQANLLPEGNIPLVSSGGVNNGVVKFINTGDGKSQLFSGNLITVDMFGQPFYHPYEFYGVSHGRLNILVPNFDMNAHIGHFLTTMLQKVSSGKYSYNRMCSSRRLVNQIISLPVDTNGNPDWSFMENFMKEVETLVQPSMDFTEHVITDTRELDDVEWGEFEIGELFDISRGRNFPRSDWKSGSIPIITTTGLNNGITDFISNPNDKVSKNSLTVAGTGTVGSTFYHEYEHNVGEWVLSLTLKDKDLNKHLALFLTTVISYQKDKYSYAYKLGNERLSAQKILLPVTPNGNPDWDFMEQYMKRIENNLMKRVENVVA